MWKVIQFLMIVCIAWVVFILSASLAIKIEDTVEVKVFVPDIYACECERETTRKCVSERGT